MSYGRAAVGDKSLRNLCTLREVEIPEGVEAVGDRWFAGTTVERVLIPTSVVSLGTDAFCQCRCLREVVFAEDSRLEVIWAGCFRESRLERIEIPASVISIEK